MSITVETDYYSSLYEVAAAVNSAGTPETVLRSIVANTSQAMGAKGCALMILTPDERLIHAAVCGLSDWYIRKGPLLANMSIPEALEGRAVAISNATEDERIQYRRLARKEGIASILSVPMKLRGQVIGVMRIYTGESRNFTDEDIYFVSAIANLGAIALENATLDESIEQAYDTFQQRMKEWGTALEEGCVSGDFQPLSQEYE